MIGACGITLPHRDSATQLQLDRVGAGNAVGQGYFLQAKNEVFAGRRVEDVDGPGQRTVSAGFRLLQSEKGSASHSVGAAMPCLQTDRHQQKSRNNSDSFVTHAKLSPLMLMRFHIATQHRIDACLIPLPAGFEKIHNIGINA